MQLCSCIGDLITPFNPNQCQVHNSLQLYTSTFINGWVFTKMFAKTVKWCLHNQQNAALEVGDSSLRNLLWTLSSQGHSGCRAKSSPAKKWANLTLVIDSQKRPKKTGWQLKMGVRLNESHWILHLGCLGGTWKIIRRKRKPFCKSNSQFGSCAFAIVCPLESSNWLENSGFVSGWFYIL